jgi:hypothetical protein
MYNNIHRSNQYINQSSIIQPTSIQKQQQQQQQQ